MDPDTGVVTFAEPEFAEELLFEPAVMGQGGDAFWCGAKEGHFIRVGETHKLTSWDQVDCDDSHSCVRGLHCGGLRYIEGYQNGEGMVTHNIFVDPMHIGAIIGLGTGNDGAMRVKQYFVHSTFTSVNRNIYHSSKYAELTDAEYDTMVKEAVEKHANQAQELHEASNEAVALSSVVKKGL